MGPLILIPLVGLFATCLRFCRAIASRIRKRRALRDIRGPPSASFLTGHLKQIIDPSGLNFFDELLLCYGSVARLSGLCGDALLCISDPVALTHILVNDSDTFPEVDLTGTTHVNMFMLGPGLLTTNGSQHRRQRKVLNPAFSGTKIRHISPLVQEVVKQFRSSLITRIELSGGDIIDVAPSLGHLALEVVGQAHFGCSFFGGSLDALKGDSEGSEYVSAAKELVPALTALGPLLAVFVAIGLADLPPPVLRAAGDGVSYIFPTLRRFMAIVDTLYRTSRDLWESKKAELIGGNMMLREAVEHSDDLLGVLLGEGATSRMGPGLPEEELLSQLNTLVLAGVETTSNALCRILHLLALNQDIQGRLRAEIVQAGQDVDYDALTALPLLDAVCRETLRLYAPLPYRNRIAAEETAIPLSSGETLHVPAGTEVLVNCHGLNTDPAVWGTDAQEWQPERWFKPLPKVEIPGVYAHSMSFLGGPKACLGFSFAILEMKTTLAMLLPVFKFISCPDQEIVWRFGPLISPSVNGEKSLHPKMPLRLERILDPTVS
ncbi:unnamed protein product [Peniophora sp. CBMAI 1063]|nr:unnamed protein product [Peniophora sp. CBMAI 1063]